MLFWESKLEEKYHQNPLLVKQEFVTFSKRVNKLTPAGKALLMKIYKYCNSRQNVEFDRSAVGFMLGRHRYQLALWDRRLLERLLDLNLISMRWQAIPAEKDKYGRWVGRGRKMVYSIDIDVIWMIRMNIKKSKQKQPNKLA